MTKQKLCAHCDSVYLSSPLNHLDICPRCEAKTNAYETRNYPNVIGLTGPAGSGKDTAADYLITYLIQHEKISFADPLKTMLAVGLNLTLEQLHGSKKETLIPELGCTPRRLMQTLGTDWGRDLIHPDIWVVRMQRLLEHKPFLIIPDVRFPNEAKFVRDNGRLIYIAGRAAYVEQHQSELPLLATTDDRIVVNSGSVEQLKQQLDRLINEGF